MLAEYNIPFSSSIRSDSLDDDDEDNLLMPSVVDDFFNHDSHLLQDATMVGVPLDADLDFLHLNQDSVALLQAAAAAGASSWNEFVKSAPPAGAPFGSPGADSLRPGADGGDGIASNGEHSGPIIEGVFGSPGSDSLNGMFLGVLQGGDNSETEALLMADLLQSDLDLAYNIEVSDSDDSVAYSTASVVNSVPPSPVAKRKKLDDVKWSEMDSEDQARALLALRDAIANQASLREQLELLRMTGQDMTVLPTDSRFHIDAANIDDGKLERIRDYLSKMARGTSSEGREKTVVAETGHSQNGSVHKKSVLRRTQQKFTRRRGTKKQPHPPKEPSINLFDREEVLSLQLEDSNDEEINVLD